MKGISKSTMRTHHAFLRIRDVLDEQNKVKSDFSEFMQKIRKPEIHAFYRIIQNEAYNQTSDLSDAIPVIEILLDGGIEAYLCDHEAVQNYYVESGQSIAYEYTTQQKMDDILVGIHFEPNCTLMPYEEFKMVYNRYFKEMTVECIIKPKDSNEVLFAGDFADYQEAETGETETGETEIVVKKMTIYKH